MHSAVPIIAGILFANILSGPIKKPPFGGHVSLKSMDNHSDPSLRSGFKK
jgi:hypothetical protein